MICAPITLKERRTVIADHEQGMPIKVTAARLGVGYDRVRYIRKRLRLRSIADRRYFTPEQIEDIKTRYLAGEGPTSIGKTYGKKSCHISRVVARLGIQPSMAPRYSREWLYRMALMYDGGVSMAQVMKVFRCSKDTVKKALRTFKVGTRPPSGHAPRITDQQVANLRDTLGWSFSAIGRHFGMARTSISWRYHRWHKKKNAAPTG